MGRVLLRALTGRGGSWANRNDWPGRTATQPDELANVWHMTGPENASLRSLSRVQRNGNMRMSASKLGVLLATVIVLSGCTTATGGSAMGNPDAVLGTVSPAPESIAPESTGQPSSRSALTVPGSTEPRPQSSPQPALTGTAAAPGTAASASGGAGPTIPATDLDGEVYGFIRAVDPASSQITLDKVDWFTGAAAQQACAEDGVQGTDNNWCTGYYFRNVNPALRVVAVSPQATIRTLGNSPTPTASDLATVAARIATTSGATSTYHLTVTNGEVTDLQEMYRP